MKKTVMIVLMCLGLVAVTQAEVLIYDSFDGAAGALNGRTPDVGAYPWFADDTYLNLDGAGLLSATSSGSFEGNNGFLPFTPENGKIYVLSAKVDVLSGDYWLGLGWTQDSTSVDSGFIWIPAHASIIYKDNGGTGAVESFVTGDWGGTGNLTSDELGVDISGEVFLECVLDTSQSTTSWSWATYVNGAEVLSGTWGDNPTIAGVALGVFGADGSVFNATVDDFILQSFDSSQARNPRPYDGNTKVLPTLGELSWVNPPDPNFPTEVITCDVYIELDDGDPNIASAALATGIAANSITLSDYGFALAPETTYHWRVDCTEPNLLGSPVTTEGEIWTFTTVNDDPPVVDAGPDQWGWLDPVDPNNTIIVLDGTVSDDGQSPLTTEWTILGQDPAEASVVIDDPNAVDTFVTVNSTGYYIFQLEAQDGLWVDNDAMAVTVHATACEAAYNDPDDIPATHPDTGFSGQIIGDIDGDCDIDLADFAILARDWMACLSEKLGCTP